MLISDNWAELLQPGLRKIFDKHQKQLKDYIPVVYNVEDSKKAQEFNLGVGELGMMDEWTGAVSYEDFNKGFKSTYTHKKYSKGIEIERELLDDDQYSEIKKRVKKLSMTVYYTRQYHAASVFNLAFGGILGPDSKALCASDHPVMPNSSTTFSNAGVLPLNATNVEKTRTDMMAWKDDKGNLLMINPDTILVPPNLRKPAMIIAETDEEPDTADHGINVWKGHLNVIEWPFLTNPYYWFLVDMQRMKLLLNWYNRRKPDFDDKIEFDSEIAKYKTVGRWSYGWDDPTFIYGHKATS